MGTNLRGNGLYHIILHITKRSIVPAKVLCKKSIYQISSQPSFDERASLHFTVKEQLDDSCKWKTNGLPTASNITA